MSIVSSDTETANDVYRILVGQGLARTEKTPPSYRYEATGNSADDFLDLAHRLAGPEVSTVDLVETGVFSLSELVEFAATHPNSEHHHATSLAHPRDSRHSKETS